MNKIISTLTVSAFLGISTLSANGVDSALNSAKSKTTQTLSKTDSEFLFGTSKIENLNVEILSQKELEETQGAFWGDWFLKWIKFPPVQHCCLAVKK